jgi:hypothetical protein
VPRAGDAAVEDAAFADRAALVPAHVRGGEDASLVPPEREAGTGDGDHDGTAFRDAVDGSGVDETVGSGSGASGGAGADGVIDADAADATESPAPFVALTVKRYPVPFDRPVHVAAVPVTTHEAPEGSDVTV